MPRFVVSGTDTDIGKTVFAAGLAHMLEAYYWKPVQAGLDGQTDSEFVRKLGLPGERLLPEAYRLRTPCSPHQAAQIDGVTIDRDRLELPAVSGNLVIEGAGGVLVPLTLELLYADVFAVWQLPVVLVSSTRLGTINHSLLSIEALRKRAVPLHGIAFIGDANAQTEAAICTIGEVRHLGRLPIIEKLDGGSLHAAFAANFRRENFA